MSTLRSLVVIGFVIAVASTHGVVSAKDEGGTGDGSIVGLGTPIDQAEVDRLSITIYPDGRNLPNGSGSVGDGRVLYEKHCALCHGERGIEGPASRLAGPDGFTGPDDPDRMARIQKFPLLMLSVDALWPYATTVFDYTRRAMPHVTPKSLTNEEVYAITAYVLFLHGIVDEDTELNQENLPKVEMPGDARTVLAWPEASQQSENIERGTDDE